VRSDIKTVDPNDVFGQEILDAADIPYVSDEEDESDRVKAKAQEEARVGLWRRSMIEHLHYITENNRQINEQKASHLSVAQTAFFGFLAAFAVLAGMIVWVAVGPTSPKDVPEVSSSRQRSGDDPWNEYSTVGQRHRASVDHHTAD